MDIDKLDRLLRDNGFRRVSERRPDVRTYVDDENILNIFVERFKDELTPEDEEKIRTRLIQLGYLDG